NVSLSGKSPTQKRMKAGSGANAPQMLSDQPPTRHGLVQNVLPPKRVHAHSGPSSRVLRSSIIRSGFPAATTPAGTSFLSTEHAPITAPRPTVTPGPINARAPIQLSSPIVIVDDTRGKFTDRYSCVPVQR